LGGFAPGVGSLAVRGDELYMSSTCKGGVQKVKIRTLLDTVPDALGEGGSQLDMRWSGPGGHDHRGGAAVLVSNNRYRLGRAVGSGTRPRIDDGLLGITVMGAPTDGDQRRLSRPWREWSAPSFQVDADRPLPAGVDGEALVLDAPLRFVIRPGVLRVRIAHQHPGSSPSARAPEGLRDGFAELVRIALGRDRKSASSTVGAGNGPS